MIDIESYRVSENNAKNSSDNWIISKKYNLDIFEANGFPVRIQNIQQTHQLFDTMQENRFELFMKELGGFDKKELEIFIDSCIKNIKFQQSFFPNKKAYIPFDTIINSFILVQKLQMLCPNAERILDIGPGTGSFSFFLNNFDNLKEYTYTDACESFYMLQNNINFYLFGENFIQHTFDKLENELFVDESNEDYSLCGVEKRYFIENNIDQNSFKCNAYPWWKLGKLDNNNSKYDIITSNANLLEFSEGALEDYLKLMNNKLTSNGIVFAHCTGSNLSRDIAYLFDKLYKHKFAIVLNVAGNIDYKDNENTEQNSYFVIPNLLFIGKKHPLFSKYYKKHDVDPLRPRTTRVIPDKSESKLYDYIFPKTNNTKTKIIYTKSQLQDLISKKLGI